MQQALEKFIKYLQSYFPLDGNNTKFNHTDLQKLIETGLKDTLSKTIKKLDDGTYFVITGDIPAMWLRDSSAQIRPFLTLTKDEASIREIVKGIIEKHKSQILLDPYANAFNETDNNAGHHDDSVRPSMGPWIWEKKYEIDSLCYPLQLAYLYYINSGDSTIFDDKFLQVIDTVCSVFETEQDHENMSPYYFTRTNEGTMSVAERVKHETLARDGLGTPTKKCGLVWSGFRPSDDACQLGYLIPSNMFIVVVMDMMSKVLKEFYPQEKQLYKRVLKLGKSVKKATYKFGVVKHPKYGKVFAYEVDGLGNFLLMDDANVPSLLSAPYLGFIPETDKLYKNTRRFLLSSENPFYYAGDYATGIGSPHTPPQHVWHISKAIEGLTTNNKDEQEEIVTTFLKTHADTFMMHEGFNVNNPSEYSRPWFSWANSIFIEFLMNYLGIGIETK